MHWADIVVQISSEPLSCKLNRIDCCRNADFELWFVQESKEFGVTDRVITAPDGRQFLIGTELLGSGAEGRVLE